MTEPSSDNFKPVHDMELPTAPLDAKYKYTVIHFSSHGAARRWPLGPLDEKTLDALRMDRKPARFQYRGLFSLRKKILIRSTSSAEDLPQPPAFGEVLLVLFCPRTGQGM
jgi:hypothetical protein